MLTFSAKNTSVFPYQDINFNVSLNNHVISFEHLGSGIQPKQSSRPKQGWYPTPHISSQYGLYETTTCFLQNLRLASQ